MAAAQVDVTLAQRWPRDTASVAVVVPRSAIRCGEIPRSAIRCGEIPRSVIRCGEIPLSAIGCGEIPLFGSGVDSKGRDRAEMWRDRAEMEHASLRESSALLGEGNQDQLRAIRGDRTCASRVHFWAQLELNVACSARVLRPTQGEV